MVDNVGCWLLVAGCWLLAAGCWLLARGFGLLDAETVRRYAAGTPEQLDHPTDTLLAAGPLVEVFRLQ